MGCIQSHQRRTTATKKKKPQNTRSDPEQTWSSHHNDDENDNNADALSFYKTQKRIALAQVHLDGRHLQFVSPEPLQHDRDIVLAACQQNGLALAHAPIELRSDRDIALTAITQNVRAIYHSTDSLRADKDFAWAACRHDGMLLQHVHERLRADKDVVLAACDQSGLAIRYSCDALQADKEVVLAAAVSNPEALHYAKGCLSYDPDCVAAASAAASATDGLSGGKSVFYNKFVSRIVLSTRYSLEATSSSTGSPSETRGFGILLRESDYIRNGNFSIYSPNAFAKESCDPTWTDFHWPCRGTFETCQMEDSLKRGIPQGGSCWRYAFRYQLEEAKRTNGCMIQLVERANKGSSSSSSSKNTTTPQCLANGQQIEAAMARDVGTKVFRVHAPVKKDEAYCDVAFTEKHIGVLVSVLREWYETNGNNSPNDDDKNNNMSDCLIQFVGDKWQSWDL